MSVRIQLRGDVAANWTSVNPILAEREFAVETDTLRYKIGDGVTSWTGLTYQGLSGATGPQGPQGIQGNEGPQGPQGIQGVSGNTPTIIAGTNIITGGTSESPVISLTDSPIINNLTFSGTAIGGTVQAGAGTFTSLSTATLSGGTILSGSTDLSQVFAPIEQTYAYAQTGVTISYTQPEIYNSDTSAGTGNISNNLTGAKIGIVQKLYHNDVTEPTVPAGWVLVGSGTYTTSVLNIIYSEWVSGTRVEYWIVQEA